MDAMQQHALLSCLRGNREGGPGAVCDILRSDQFSEKRLSGHAEEERSIFNGELIEMTEEET